MTAYAQADKKIFKQLGITYSCDIMARKKRKMRVVVRGRKNHGTTVLGLLIAAIGAIWFAKGIGWIAVDLSLIGPVVLIALGLIIIIRKVV
jgi:hypothetical protein